MSKPTFLQDFFEEVKEQERETGFFRNELEDFHRDFSVKTLWEKSYICPCRNPETNQPDPLCKLCQGRKYAYLPAKELYMIVQSNEKGTFNGDIGLLDTGAALATPALDHRITFRDRITIPDMKVSQSMIFDVTQHRIDHGFYCIYDVHEVEYIRILNHEIHEGEDYTFNFKENRIYPKAHLLGENISVNILTTLRYNVANLLKEHRYEIKDDKTRPMFQQALIKREDIHISSEAFEIGKSGQITEDIVDPKEQASMDGFYGFFNNKG